jgi:hypothetical protein
MLRRYCLWFALLGLLVQGLFTGGVKAASAYVDVQGHWAEEQIQFLLNQGVYKPGGMRFYPDNPIARGEALALLNRVCEAVYGPLAKPKTKGNIDHRYPLKREIEGLLANLQVMLNIEAGFVSDFDPGDRMLYYLYLSTRNQLMKQPLKEQSDWWLSAQSLQQPLSREEASMLLFHMLATDKMKAFDVKPEEVVSFYNGYYQWKHRSEYRDTASPYATAIRDYHMFSSAQKLEPDKNMTRAQFAVVLKRLYDYYKADARQDFQSNRERQQKVANLYLTAATLAYQNQDQEQIKRYFDQSAQKSLKELAPLPLHDYSGELLVMPDDSDKNKLWAIGQYQHPFTGKYEVRFLFQPDQSNSYGWKVTAVEYVQK